MGFLKDVKEVFPTSGERQGANLLKINLRPWI